MKNGKRLVTVALSAVMAFGVMSVNSFAAIDLSGYADTAQSVISSGKDKINDIKNNNNSNTTVTQESSKTKAFNVIKNYDNHTGEELTAAFETLLDEGSGTSLSEQKAFKSDCEDYMNDNKTALGFDEDDIDAVMDKVDDYLDDVRHDANKEDLSNKLSSLTGDDSSITNTDGTIDTSKVKDYLNEKGYSDEDISAVLKKAGLSDDEIAEIMGEEIEDESTPLASAVSFTDDHIAYVKGYADGTFKPDNGVTRAEAATILYNLLDDDTHAKMDTTSNSFTDLTQTWYVKQISTLANAGIIKGYDDGTFRPDNKVTRAEFVKMVVEVMGYVEGATEPFADVSQNDWYYNAVATAYMNGWVQAGSTFNPKSNMSRAEVVTFLNRVLDRCVDTNFINTHVVLTFSDVNSGDWYYGAVMEAANSHEHTVTTQGVEEWVVLN